MDTLTRIEHITDQWLRCTEKRETLDAQIIAYKYQDRATPRKMEAQLEILDRQALALAERLYELACKQLAEGA